MSSLRAERPADAESRPPLDQSPSEPTVIELACSCGAVVRTRQPVAGMTCPVCGLTLALPTRAATVHSVGGGATTVARAGSAVDGSEPATAHRKGQIEERGSRRLPPARLGWAPSWRRTALLLVVVCSIVIGLTLRFEWRRRAAIQLGDHLAAGRQALAAAKFDEAASSLSQAARAARTLDDHSPQVVMALALDREAQVWSRLSPRTIDEFFSEHGSSGGTNAERTFDREFAGRALVFDGFIEPVVARANYADGETFGPRPPEQVGADGEEPPPLPPDLPEAGEQIAESAAKSDAKSGGKSDAIVVANPWQLDWQLAGPGYTVELASDELSLFEGLPRSGATRVIFGGVIDRLERLPGDGAKWRLHLVPQSCVLLTIAGPLAQQQWPDEAGWRAVLASQARLLIALKAGNAEGAIP